MGLTDLFFVKILRGAVSEVVARWRPLFRALILPAVLMVGSSYATQYLMRQQYNAYGSIESLKVMGHIQLIVWVLLYTLCAMSCHRMILLGEKSLPNRYGIYWTFRETRFLGWLILVGTIYLLLSFPFQSAAVYLGWSWHDWRLTWYLPLLLATYIDGRISMVLPATAVGERSSIVASWRLTQGNGLHIATALFIAAIATDLVGLGTRYLLNDLPQTARLVSNVLNFPLVAVAVGILSVTYRELTQENKTP